MDHMVKGPVLAKVNTNTYTNLLHSSSQTRPENVCWKCEKEGTLLICSRNAFGAKVHKKCLSCLIYVDEDGTVMSAAMIESPWSTLNFGS
ncbi:unnamed protein product [Arabis nemorensis]|uniref:Uncharacterized protein n=1 Tax=Arabis nemorensis TaxID=586526 RepID=A0A565APN9_9BRAS|nr:unnamed protein product [Arabis nemorensis]